MRKPKPTKVSSAITPEMVRAMQEQQRLADEARVREQQLIQQQTAQQAEQYNQMLGLYQQQIAALEASRAEQTRYLEALAKQQEEQQKAVDAERQRQAILARNEQEKSIQEANKLLSIMGARRNTQQQQNRQRVFSTAYLPVQFTRQNIMG
jgi:hypothetical protein